MLANASIFRLVSQESSKVSEEVTPGKNVHAT